jgi:hypothetical protein
MKSLRKSLLMGTAVCSLLSATTSPAATLLGLFDSSEGQGLYVFDSGNSWYGNSFYLSGIGAGEKLLAIDTRPANGQVYALSSGSSIYTLNLGTGVATKVGTGFTTMLTGTHYGFDFNPTIDRIRIVGNNGQNIVANPTNGLANVASTVPVFYGAGDPNNGATPNVVHHAYDNNFSGALTSQLRAIDVNLNILVTQANNAGTLGTVGPLGFDAKRNGGFDVDAAGTAWFANADGLTTSSLYTINLATGAATLAGQLPCNIMGLTAVDPALVPEPSSLALVGLGGLALLRRRC